MTTCTERELLERMVAFFADGAEGDYRLLIREARAFLADTLACDAEKAVLVEALEGVGSRIGGIWHRLGCEAFQRPYGECDYACVQARAALAPGEPDA
jgi:hypothetical protein